MKRLVRCSRAIRWLDGWVCFDFGLTWEKTVRPKESGKQLKMTMSLEAERTRIASSASYHPQLEPVGGESDFDAAQSDGRRRSRPVHGGQKSAAVIRQLAPARVNAASLDAASRGGPGRLHHVQREMIGETLGLLPAQVGPGTFEHFTGKIIQPEDDGPILGEEIEMEDIERSL